MEVDFSFQLLRRFHPEVLTPGLRAEARSFVQATNLDTYRLLSRVFDLASGLDPDDDAAIRSAMTEMRREVDESTLALRRRGEWVLDQLHRAYVGRGRPVAGPQQLPEAGAPAVPDALLAALRGEGGGLAPSAGFGVFAQPIPYEVFRSRLESA
jgi:anaerobic magnesium-protoporphyrin IX monomethyl ester cyclase